jgi:hypothetical protein
MDENAIAEEETTGAEMNPQKGATILQNQISEAKSATGVFELPCGYLDSEGTLHTEVVVREITGFEEDMLANPKIRPSMKINELISRCTERIGTITDRGKVAGITKALTVGDRLFLVFAVRRVTIGDVYQFEAKCPHCNTVGDQAVDLGELEVKKMPDPYKRIFDVTLPNSGIAARFHPMTGVEEEKLEKINRKKTDSLSLALLMRLEMLGDSPPSMPKVKALGMKDRIFLRDEFNKVEGGLDTEIEFTCDNCFEEFKQDLDVGQASFFFPSESRKS